jgi:PPE-repeat protein
MFSVQFNGSEDGIIPTDITYHQLGILINPTTKQLSPQPANGTIYKTSTDVVVAPGFGTYNYDEIVYQGDTNNPSFTGTILSFDPASNVIRLINTKGTVTTNAPIYGRTSLTTRTVLTYSLPNFVLFSGYLSYIENRTGITRSVDGIEQFKLVLGY